MRGFKIDRRGSPALERFFPARDTNTPAIAWFQPGKAPFGMRGDEVVSIEHGKIQELTCHLNANRMQSGVFGAGATIPVAIESGHRIAATAFQFCSKNVRWHGRHSASKRFIVQARLSFSLDPSGIESLNGGRAQ